MALSATSNWKLTLILFIVLGFLACLEKLAVTANTVAVERDWVIVISDSINVPRQGKNGSIIRAGSIQF